MLGSYASLSVCPSVCLWLDKNSWTIIHIAQTSAPKSHVGQGQRSHGLIPALRSWYWQMARDGHTSTSSCIFTRYDIYEDIRLQLSTIILFLFHRSQKIANRTRLIITHEELKHKLMDQRGTHFYFLLFFCCKQWELLVKLALFIYRGLEFKWNNWSEDSKQGTINTRRARDLVFCCCCLQTIRTIKQLKWSFLLIEALTLDEIIEQKIANRERLTHEELKYKLVEKRGTRFFCKQCSYCCFEFSKMRRHAEGRS